MSISRIIVAAIILASVSNESFAGEPEAINLRKTVTVEVVAKTKGAVVNISSTKLIAQRVSPFGADPFFQQFDGGQTVHIPASSLGSGFIIHEDGYVVTNNHVVEHARQINVELDDGRKLPAELISTDPDSDLAILKISDQKPFPILKLGDSGDLMIGEPVIAIGNPLGYSHSVSTGIVSAIHRDLKDGGDHGALSNVIQTDAAINPGNSGGPLLNAYGQVIAINTAIRSDAQNIGFAIPVNRLLEMIPELMSPGHAKKFDLGIKLSEQRTVSPPANVESRVILADQPGRVVESIAGHPPRDIIDAYAKILSFKPGDEIEIKWTDGKKEKIAAKAIPISDAIVQAKSKLGLTIEALTPMLAEKYHINVDEGILVDAVGANSISAKAGVQPGDIVVQLGRYRISTLDDLSTLLTHLPTSGKVRVGIVRNDQLGFGALDFGNKAVTRLKVLIAPDKFKHSLSADAAARAIADGVNRASADIEIDLCPMADGGEGTVEALVTATGGRFETARVTGPLPDMKVEARFGILGDGVTAVVEMAAASGLHLLAPYDRDPLRTTTFGTGELLLAAIRLGVRQIILGIGGSATNDVGIGCAQACGLPVLMKDAEPTSPTEPLTGADLERVAFVKRGRGSAIDGVKIIVATDVTNPLYGPTGAASVFGPQKGATPAQIQSLDRAAEQLAIRGGHEAIARSAGSGAAGGLGFAMAAFFNAALRPGIDIVMDAVELPRRLSGSQLCITGEGCLDEQSLGGKTAVGIARACKNARVPCVALVGSADQAAPRALAEGLTAYFSICDGPMTLDDAMRRTAALLCDAAENVTRLYLANHL